MDAEYEAERVDIDSLFTGHLKAHRAELLAMMEEFYSTPNEDWSRLAKRQDHKTSAAG